MQPCSNSRRGVGRSLVLAGFLALGSGATATLAAQSVALPEALHRLERLEGSWEADRVEFLDPEGNVVRTSSAEVHNELDLDGRVLVHRGLLHQPPIETRGWYYWDPTDEQLHMGSVSSGGRYDEFVGGWEGDRLVMITLPNPTYDGRLFRLTQSRITRDSFREKLEVSDDGGETWRVSSRQWMRRSGAPERSTGGPAARHEASVVLAAMDAYTGHWKSDRKTDAEGDTFHFEYDLEWLDSDRRITRMRITRVAGADTSVVFEGYKGAASGWDGVFYIATSPSGRGARGEVVLDGSELVTLYQGWSPDGTVVQIRDVFAPVKDGAFVSRTFLRRSADVEWRRIGEDRWRRIEPPSQGDR